MLSRNISEYINFVLRVLQLYFHPVSGIPRKTAAEQQQR